MNKLLSSLAAATFASSMLFAQSASNNIDLTPIDMDPELRYGILDNGLTYYIRHNHVVPDRADFYIVQNVGAILENDDQNGLAHFLEHMAFNGTKNFPGKKIIDYLETIGVQFGNNINAYTSLDETVYNLKSVPTIRESIVDSALMVLHDWSGFISLEGEEIDKERGVIREEWRTRMNASRRLWKASLPILYPNSQYAKRDVIGDTAVINNFSYSTLRDFYHKWYRPDLQAIIVVGDIQVDSVEQRIKEMWRDIPKRENPAPRLTFPVYNNEEPIIAVLTDPEAQTSRVQVEYRHKPLSDRERASGYGFMIYIVHSLIETMFSDRLDEISAKPESPFVAAYTGYGEVVRPIDAFTIIAVPKEGAEQSSLESILTEAERMRRHGFTATEFERAKLNLLSAYDKAYNERSKTRNEAYVKEYTQNFLDFSPVSGIEWEYDAVKKLLSLLPLDFVNHHAATFVKDVNQAILLTGPDKKEVRFPSVETITSILTNAKASNIDAYKEKEISSQLVSDRLKVQKVKKIQKNKEIEGITEWILGNGMRVILRPTQIKEDEILIYGYSEGGYSKVKNVADLPSASLAASIASNNGMGEFNQTDLSKYLAGKYVQLHPSIGIYEETFSGNSSVKDFETLLQLVYLTFKGTRKDDEAFSSLMSLYETALANQAKDPTNAFKDTVRTMTSGHHPRVFSMTPERLKQVSQERALRIFDERFEDPKDFTIYLVGNIQPDSCKSLIEKYLGGIPSVKRSSIEKMQDLGIRIPNGTIINQFERDMQVDKTSNYILLSGECDYTLKNQLTMHLIADILDIRYLESMREDEGGTYGVSVKASLSKFPVNNMKLQMTFDTDPKMEEKLMQLIHVEIDKLIQEGPLDADFNKVKENLRNKYKESQKDNKWMLNSMVVYYKDGINLSKDYLPILESISKDDISATLKNLVAQGNELKVIMSKDKSEK